MDLAELTSAMHQFVSHQGWYDPDSPKVQSPRNLAIALAVEAAELLDLFQWSEDDPDRNSLSQELADVTLYVLQLASVAGVDLEQAVLDKLRTNYGRSWER